MDEYHVPVLLEESIEGLNIHPDGTYVDVTYGGGGHSARILEKLEGGKLIAFDQDIDATDNLIADDRLIFVRHNFKYIRHFLHYYQIDQVDGILADLGVSSHDFDVPDRGFSFRFEGNLDMRMNQSSSLDASKVLNEYSEEQLWTIFQDYGEIKNWRHLVSLITDARSRDKITSTGQFLKVIEPCVPVKIEKKYLAMVFQALRIAVNDEFSALETFLRNLPGCLKPGGRAAILTFHSGEDRRVKKSFDANFRSGVYSEISGEVLRATAEEQRSNPRSGPAKLRWARRAGG